MPNILVIDWGRRHVRAVAVESAGSDVRIVKLATADRSESPTAVAELLEQTGLAKGSFSKVLVSVSGDLMQFRRLKLPPGPAAELAPMVELQAEREFGAGDEGAALDFVPVRGDDTIPHEVLVARLPTVERAAIEKACAAAGLKPTSYLLRPVGAASLASRINPALSSGAHVLILPGGGEVDLVLWEDGLPTLVRRAPANASGAVSQGELRRTVSTARIQLGDRPLDGLIFCGCDPVATQSDPPLESSFVDIDGWIEGRSSEAIDDTGQYAGAVGVAVAELAGEPHAVDLLNPRSSEEEAPSQRPKILAAAAAVALLLGGAWLAYARLTQHDAETANVRSELAAEEKVIEKFSPMRVRADAIDEWLATDVAWLNELERLGRKLRPQVLESKEFLAETDVLVTGLTATARGGAKETGGQIELKGAARDADALDDLERELRDADHQVQPGAVATADTPGLYRTTFQATLTAPPASTVVPGAANEGGQP
ncbi:hypothetical protein Pla175_33780 [Pirellulimonas nuda]|uniref:Competence protein A n=1 Tax=Pirellulimonas nuda TaxID=2528009 RepID=A0A518DES6_9BACT|nr:hypothetical protein [Pirellulimonas nuda]QDU89979.1 hypothetical protein Pla175_33780 [Pirellulimonas nuda]